MARKRTATGSADKGRNYYETTSPWETQTEPSGRNRAVHSYSGLVDQTINPTAAADRSGPSIMASFQTQQYDNPRGFPGLSMITSGDQKSKLGKHDTAHSIEHGMEGQARLTRTGK